MDEKREKTLVQIVKDTFRHAVLDTVIFRDEVTHVVDAGSLVAICNFLKTDPRLRMNYIVDVIGVDYHPRTPRFEVVYHMYSIIHKHRLRLKVLLDEGQSVPSVSSVWPGANWPEREAYDMFGIVFDGHPNLKRIYLTDDWVGYPLRKDYPLKGYKDRYNPYGVEKEED